MAASDVTELLDRAIAETAVESIDVRHRPRLLSDKELAEYLRNRLEHTRGKPYHPMTQGHTERSHRTMKRAAQAADAAP